MYFDCICKSWIVAFSLGLYYIDSLAKIAENDSGNIWRLIFEHAWGNLGTEIGGRKQDDAEQEGEKCPPKVGACQKIPESSLSSSALPELRR